MGTGADQEVEWQFDAATGADVIAWLEHAAIPGYAVTPGATKKLVDTYYDTADWRLHRAGFTCRVRQKGATAELTLKSMAAARDGLRSRRELNESLPGLSHPSEAPGRCGEMVRLIAGRHSVEPLFTLLQLRRTFALGDAGGEAAEIAVDETQVSEAAPPFCRVEVEVVDGALERVQRFVDVFRLAARLKPGRGSKFEAGLAASGLRPLDPVRELRPETVHPGMTAAEAGINVLRKHFAVLLANEGGTRLGEDIEALHDMRVATRRLRAAMAAFRPWLPLRMEVYRRELGWVGAALGGVRDLDVQLEQLHAWSEAEPALAAALASVEALLRERRALARKRMLVALDAQRYKRLIDRFTVFLGGPAVGYRPGRVPVLQAAPGVIEQRYRTVRKRGGRINADSPATDYHRLRIDVKKLRYALEFFGPLYGRALAPFIARVTALQDVLGEHQDAEVAIEHLHVLAVANGRRLGPAAVLAMGAISERYRARAVELRRAFPEAFKGIRGRPWHEVTQALAAGEHA